MEIQARCTDRNLLLKFSGEVDHHSIKGTIQELEQAVEAALPRNLMIDMEGVTFMDSSGIALLLRAQKCMKSLEGSLVVCHVPDQARRVLDAAGISRLIRIQ